MILSNGTFNVGLVLKIYETYFTLQLKQMDVNTIVYVEALTCEIATFEALALGGLPKTYIHASHFRRGQTGAVRVIAMG